MHHAFYNFLYDCEPVFLIYGVTVDGLSCLGCFKTAEKAYEFASKQAGGVVVPGTKVSGRRNEANSDDV